MIKRLHNSKGNLVKIYSIGLPRLLTHGYLEEKMLGYMIITKFDVDLEYLYC